MFNTFQSSKNISHYTQENTRPHEVKLRQKPPVTHQETSEKENVVFHQK